METLTPAKLTETQLDDIRSDCLADDVDIPWPEAKHWNEDEAIKFFESGGTIRPIANRVRDVATLLAEAKQVTNGPLLEKEVLVDIP